MNRELTYKVTEEEEGMRQQCEDTHSRWIQSKGARA